MKNEELLQGIIEILGRQYGTIKVALEAERQSRVARVERVVKTMGINCLNPKIRRIKIVYNLGFGSGLKWSKEWVEANFEDNGAGPPK